MCRKILSCLFLTLFLNIYPWYISSIQAKAPHGIILISLDTLRADHLGTYGYHRDTSPFIDAFAKQSIVFDYAVVQSPWTLPSHMSIMTSLYPSSHGVLKKENRLDDEHVTLAELLREGGYRTAAFADGAFLRGVYGFKQGFDIYDGDSRIGIARILPKAQKWLEENKSTPFFLFIHCYDIHDPYNPPPSYDSVFHDFNYNGHFVPSTKNMQRAAWEDLKVNDEDLSHIEALYDGGIRYTDEKIGEFLSYLQDTGLKDNSLIIITSDHGEEFKEHGSFLHWQLYFRPNLHVPLIIRIPSYPKKEVRINELVKSIDLLPTILNIAGLPAHPKAQGISFLPLIKRHKNVLSHSLWRIFHPFGKDENISIAEQNFKTDNYSSIIIANYQLIYNLKSDSIQLFDLKYDPLTQNNIAKDHDDVLERLLLQLNEVYSAIPYYEASIMNLDAQTREQLEALGYIVDPRHKSICLGDFDCDGICNPGESLPTCSGSDNCPETPNPLQEDNCPSGGNGCGDACECEGDFDSDRDVDVFDLSKWKKNLGRKNCTQQNPCEGDFDCDGNVDDDDFQIIKKDYGRTDCPSCTFICPYE